MTTGPVATSPLSLARLRALIAFAAFASGIAAATLWPAPSLVWFSVAAGLCAAAILTKSHACRVSMALCALALGAGWSTLRTHEPGPNTLVSLLAPEESPLITVEGVALDDPHLAARRAGALDRFSFSQPRTRIDLDADTLVTSQGPIQVRGKLWVRIAGTQALDLRAGDRLRLTGLFDPPDPPMNPGEQDLRLLANETGFSGSLTLSDPSLAQHLATPPTLLSHYRAAWLRWQASLQARAHDIITRAGGEEGPARSLLLGLVLGDYDPSQHEVRDAFARQGLAHILSISGFHLSVMSLLALMLLRLTGDRGWVEPIIVAALVLAYLLIIPPSSPILRSAIMVLALLVAEARARRYDRLTLLAWIAIALLVWRPLDLWSLGFQLSLGLTAALFWLGNTVHARLWGVPLKGTVRREVTLTEKVLDHLKQSVSTGVMCWALSAPLIMCRLGLISPLAIAATVLVTPLIVLVLWIGYTALLVGVFVPAAADAAGHVLSSLSSWTVRSVQLFDAMPLSAVRIPVVPAAWGFLATLLAIYWIKRGHFRDRLAWTASAALAGWFAWIVTLGAALPGDTPLRIDTLYVGSGTCHLIRSGQDAMLWDCGAMKSGGVQPAIVQAARALGAWRTPTVVITHPDLDHFGGLPEALDPLAVRDVYFCERFTSQAEGEPRGSAAALLAELNRRHIRVHTLAAGDQLALGHATLTFLNPPRAADWKLDNDHSLVARIDIPNEADGQPSLLLTGDIQESAIAAIEAANPGLHPRAFELPHHGSAHAAAIDFTQQLNPDIIIQSTNASRLNDPRWSRARPGRLWYTTSYHGAVWIEFKETGEALSGSFH